jgi:trk system potassium uptake protein
LARRSSSSAGVVVIGMGRFGLALAEELMEDGVEVLGIDHDGRTVQGVAGNLTHVVQADSTDVDVMRQLGVHEFDRAVVAIGSALEASVLTTSVLLELKVPHVWCKAVSEPHARILTQLGAHHVVRPEHDMGRRVAHLVRGRMLDYIEFDDGYAIVKTRPPRQIVGVPLGQSRVRSQHGVTIVGVKRTGQDFTHATPDTVVRGDDLIIVSGPRQRVELFSEMT